MLIALLCIPDLRRLIFNKLSIRNCLMALSACRSLSALLQDESFWEEQTKTDFSLPITNRGTLRIQGEDLWRTIYSRLYEQVTLPIYSNKCCKGTIETTLGNLLTTLCHLRSKYPDHEPILVNSNFDPIDVSTCRLHDFDTPHLHIMMIPTGHPINRGSIYYHFDNSQRKIILEGDCNGKMYELQHLRAIEYDERLVGRERYQAWIVGYLDRLNIECPIDMRLFFLLIIAR